jgi:hypothetical protein
MKMMAKAAATAALAGALSVGALGFGAGSALAGPDYWVPQPPPPGHIGQWVGLPPGQIGHIVGIPPGHWDKPWKWLK